MLKQTKVLGRYHGFMVEERLSRVEASLYEMGIHQIERNTDKRELRFPVQINHGGEHKQLDFSVRIRQADGQCSIECRVGVCQSGSLRKTLEWFLEERNREMPQRRGVKASYQFGKRDSEAASHEITLKGSIRLRENNHLLVYNLFQMIYQQVTDDYGVIARLIEGELPEEVEHNITSRYKTYQQEWQQV